MHWIGTQIERQTKIIFKTIWCYSQVVVQQEPENRFT